MAIGPTSARSVAKTIPNSSSIGTKALPLTFNHLVKAGGASLRTYLMANQKSEHHDPASALGAHVIAYTVLLIFGAVHRLGAQDGVLIARQAGSTSANIKQPRGEAEDVESLAHTALRRDSEIATSMMNEAINQARIDTSGTESLESLCISPAATDDFAAHALAQQEATTVQQGLSKGSLANRKEIGVLLRQAYLSSSLLGLSAMAVLLVTRHQWVEHFNPSDKTQKLSEEYLLWLSFFLPVDFINGTNERFLVAVNQEKHLYRYRLASALLEVGLDYLLISRYSVAGAAASTLARGLFCMAWCARLFQTNPAFQPFGIFQRDLGNYQATLKRLFSQGWPDTVNQLLSSMSNFRINALVGGLGESRLRIAQASKQPYALLFSLHTGISEAAKFLTAQFYGKAKNDKALFKSINKIGKHALALEWAVSLIGTAASTIFAQKIASFFMPAEGIAQYHRLILITIALDGLIHLLTVSTNCTRQLLAGLEDTFLASFAPLLPVLLVTLPLATFSAYQTEFDIYGILSSMIVGDFVAMCIVLTYWHNYTTSIAQSDDGTTPTSNQRFEGFLKKWFLPESQKDALPNSSAQNSESATNQPTVVVEPTEHTRLLSVA